MDDVTSPILVFKDISYLIVVGWLNVAFGKEPFIMTFVTLPVINVCKGIIALYKNLLAFMAFANRIVFSFIMAFCHGSDFHIKVIFWLQ